MRRVAGAAVAVAAAALVGASSAATAPSPPWSRYPSRAFLPVHAVRADLDPTPAPTPRPTPRPDPPPRPRVVAVPTPPRRASLGGALSGTASWYCNHDRRRGPLSRCMVGHPGGMYAAIRSDLIGHRGQLARVCLAGSKRCVVVAAVDCNCGLHANLIDLYGDAFVALVGSLGPGRVDVTLRWLR